MRKSAKIRDVSLWFRTSPASLCSCSASLRAPPRERSRSFGRRRTRRVEKRTTNQNPLETERDGRRLRVRLRTDALPEHLHRRRRRAPREARVERVDREVKEGALPRPASVRCLSSTQDQVSLRAPIRNRTRSQYPRLADQSLRRCTGGSPEAPCESCRSGKISCTFLDTKSAKRAPPKG